MLVNGISYSLFSKYSIISTKVKITVTFNGSQMAAALAEKVHSVAPKYFISLAVTYPFANPPTTKVIKQLCALINRIEGNYKPKARNNKIE
jgi:hypothetical protein